MSDPSESLSDNPTNRALVPFIEASASSDPVKQAALMMNLLTVLFSQDITDRDSSRQREYTRLIPTYGAGLHLQADEELRDEFYRHPSWKTHLGHRPKPDVHGAESAIRFAVAKVIGGGTRERNQRASMIGSALWYLAVQGVAPDNLINEIERGRGPKNRSGLKHLAALAADLRKSQEPELQENDESLDPEESVRTKPKVVRVYAPPVLAERLPPALYLVEVGRQVLLSIHPDVFVSVGLGKIPE